MILVRQTVSNVCSWISDIKEASDGRNHKRRNTKIEPKSANNKYTSTTFKLTRMSKD